MANLSNINGKFVVEQTTGYVGVGTTDPSYPIEVLNASAEIALNASGGSIYRVQSDSASNFIIRKEGVGDRLVINSAGNATFAGTGTFAGNVTLAKAVGDTELLIEADTNNNNENYNPRLHLRQDGGAISAYFGLNGDADNTFTGALANGAYIRAAGGIQFANGSGTNLAMTIDTSQNVGIGTDSPDAKLHVEGGIGIFNVSDDWQQSTLGTYLFRGANFATTISNETSALKIFPAAEPRAVGEYWGGINFMHLDPENSTWGTSYTGAQFWVGGRITSQVGQELSALVFAVNSLTTTGSSPTEKMVILPNGNVGIGITDPSAKLEVKESLYVSHPNAEEITFRLNNYGATGTDAGPLLRMFNQSGTTVVNIDSRSGSSRDTYFNQGGNVGIGTASPAQKLHLNNSATLTATYQKFTNGTATTGTTLGIDADGDFLINNGEAKEIKLYTNDTQRLTIQSGGNVGIGTTSPIEKLQVRTDTTTDNSFQGINVQNFGQTATRAGISFKCYDWVQSAIWHGRGASAAYNGALVLGTNPNTSDLTVGGVTGRMWILNNGNVGIGTDLPSQVLDVNGNIKVRGVSATKEGMIHNSGSYFSLVSTGDTSDTTGARIWLGNNASANAYYQNASTHYFRDLSSSIKMTLLSSGNLGIGTTSPLNKLQVNGDIGIGEINSTRSTNVRFAKNDVNVITFDISVGAVGAWRPGSCWIQVSGAQNGLQEYWSAWYFIRLTHYYLSGVAGQGTTNPSCILDSGGDTSSVVVGVSSTNTSNPQIITITLTDSGGTTNSMVADINCTMQMGINSIT